jgi:hypothetical protein
MRIAEADMIYLAEFLGFLLVCVALAASPLLIRLFEHFVRSEPRAVRVAPTRAASGPRSKESSELRDEIRRLTQALEMDSRAPRR